MADKILVSAQEMRATISKYNDARDVLDGARKNMDAALDHLDNCWKGPTWAAMMAKWAVINGNIAKAHMAIGRTVEALNTTIMTYDESEEKNKSAAGGLDIGTDSTIYV